jgi:branched-subunit amino acid aminotransferase/4-amino-4-deoxychorismate lyase
VYASEIATADEIFITSSFKDIVPIVKVDDRVVGDSRPGIVTMDLFDKYKKIIGV